MTVAFGSRQDFQAGTLVRSWEESLPQFTVETSTLALTSRSNVIIEGLTFAAGSSFGITLSSCETVIVRGCHFVNCPGVYAVNCTGSLFIDRCTFDGMPASTQVGHSVQFDKCSGAANRVTRCVITMPLGGSVQSDAINVYQSNGTPDSPILVDRNVIRGGGPSTSGSGILLGDSGGSYQRAARNILIRPGQAGIGVASGEFITVEDNDVASDAQAWSNVGIYAWNQYATPCDNITIQNNRVQWAKADGSNNPAWDGGNVGPIGGWATNNWNADLSALLRSRS